MNKKTPVEQLPVDYQIVLSVLRYGLENAQTGDEIIKHAQIADVRTLNLIVANLIEKHGYCIGTSRSGKYRGYYLVNNQAELGQTVSTLENQAKAMYRRITALMDNFPPAS